MYQYNGHDNYETWLACVWLDGSEKYEDTASKRDSIESLKEYFDNEIELVSKTLNPFLLDLLKGAFKEIIWRDVADYLWEDEDELEEDLEPDQNDEPIDVLEHGEDLEGIALDSMCYETDIDPYNNID